MWLLEEMQLQYFDSQAALWLFFFFFPKLRNIAGLCLIAAARFFFFFLASSFFEISVKRWHRAKRGPSPNSVLQQTGCFLAGGRGVNDVSVGAHL